jgi:predicted HNH restriction endonuclease
MGCGFDFEAADGDLGRGFAEVHHLKPQLNSTDQSLRHSGI